MRSARYAVVMPETSAVHGGRRDAPARGLLGPADVRGLVRALGIRPAKARGQNFVHDAGTVRRIVRRAGVRPGEDVLEIGPGLGSLTLALLEAGARVTAVEIDPRLARALPVTAASRLPDAAPRLRVVTADALTIDGAQNRPAVGPDAAPSGAAPPDGDAFETPSADPR